MSTTTIGIDYYTERRPIGLFELFDSIKMQEGQLIPEDMIDTYWKCTLQLAVDWRYVTLVMARLKISLERKSRWDVALDATSFFLLARIYYDTLSNIIHTFYKILNPTASRMWPTSRSFFYQLKWFEKNDHSYFADFRSALEKHSFKIIFRNMRELRNRLKEFPRTYEDPKRLVWISKEDFPETGNLQNEVGYYFYGMVKFTDYLGDYFFMKINEKFPLSRIGLDIHEYERGHLGQEVIDLYRWFNSVL